MKNISTETERECNGGEAIAGEIICVERMLLG